MILNSCTDSKTLITNKGIGEIKLGELLIVDYDKSSLDITLDQDKKIRTIIVSNPDYKTKDGFGVNSKLHDIALKYGIRINENFKANKGKVSIMDLGKVIVADSILFMDNDKNNIVDAIMIHIE